jgi:uncharacterized protein YggE
VRKQRCAPPVAVALLFLAWTAPGTAQVNQPGEPNGPSLTTSGEGVVRRAPDRAFVDVSVETRANKPRDAQSQNAEAMSSVQRSLRGADLAKDAIRTLSVSVEPEFDFANNRRVLRGYVARNAIEVRVDDLSRLGGVLDIATSAGATTVGDIRFDLKDRQSAERQALAEAVADARARSEAMASAAGRAVLGIWRLSEEGVARPPVQRPMMAGRALAAESAPTPVVAGEIEIRARVTLTVLLK